MYRGSGFLLRKSARLLVPVISAIAQAESQLWDIDVHCYTAESIEFILEFRSKVIKAFQPNSPSDILVTKIMLGVFGNVPAFDTNFKTGSGLSTFGRRSLKQVARFYSDHRETIDKYRVPTLDFKSGGPTHRCYTRAKVIDMIFFIEGAKKARSAE
jgi:hypothetical protein